MSKQKRPGFESQQLLSVHFPLRMVVKEIYEVKQCSVLNCAMRSSLLMIDLALKSLPPSKQKKWYCLQHIFKGTIDLTQNGTQ